MAADDLKALWQGLDREAESLSLDRIHGLVRRYERRVRFTGAALAVLLLLVGLLGGQMLVKAHDLVMRAMGVLFIAGEAGVCALAYRTVFPERDPAEPAGAYLRRRLQIRLDHARGRWLLMISPLFPFMALNVYVELTRHPGFPRGRLTTLIIFLLAIGLAVVRARVRARKLRAQIQELDQLLAS